jgi:hypothetical protein
VYETTVFLGERGEDDKTEFPNNKDNAETENRER